MRNNRQLARWLMKEIHGVETPRKSPKKAFSSTGKVPRNWKYKGWIRTLPCASCGQDPAGEAAHTGSDGGMRLKSSDYSCIPLCTDCHTVAPHAYHRLGRSGFESAHGISIGDLVRRLNRIWFHPASE